MSRHDAQRIGRGQLTTSEMIKDSAEQRQKYDALTDEDLFWVKLDDFLEITARYPHLKGRDLSLLLCDVC
jgi:hypothetical protein